MDADREQSLAAREEELARRERIGLELAAKMARDRRELDRLREELPEPVVVRDEERERALEAEVERLKLEVEELRAQIEAAVPSAPPAEPSAGPPTLSALEALVEAHAPSHPDRAEDWRAYVFYLRGYAEPDGTLPQSFAGLVDDVFGDLPRT